MTRLTSAAADRTIAPACGSRSLRARMRANPKLAKLSTPRMPRILPRPELFRRLDPSPGQRVVWVLGPPGIGKTALVASWIRRRKVPHVWVALDEGDSDVATLFHYIALASVGEGRRRPAFSPGHPEAPGGMARRLFRTLRAGPRAPAAIILDGYHELRSDSPVHAALGEAVADLPGGVRLVVTSRREPPAAFSRMAGLTWSPARSTGPMHMATLVPEERALPSGLLEVVHGEELAFDESEAQALARLWGYSGQDREEVVALHSRAGGWAAGLVQLLAARKPGAGQQVKGTAEHLLFDYLAKEVLGPEEPETQKVLLETAFLRRITGDIAARLTGVGRAGEILEALSRRVYLVARLDASPPVYQYHSLFREFLQGRANKELHPERLSKLRLSAASMLEEAGDLEEAFHLYLDAGACAEACRVLGGFAPRMLGEGRRETLARWLLRIPAEVRAARPWLLLWLGIAQSSLEPRAARQQLEMAFRLFWEAGNGPGAHLAWVAAAEACLQDLDDLSLLDRWLAILNQLRARFPEFPGPDVEARVVSAAFGALLNRQPWHRAFREWEDRALSLAHSALDARLRLMVGRPLIIYYGWWAADLSKARLLLNSLRQLLGESADPEVTACWLMADAKLQLHLGLADACMKAVDRGLALLADAGLRVFDPLFLSLRCWAAMMKGDLAAAGGALDQMGDAGTKSRFGLCTYHYTACVLARRHGDAAMAYQHGRLSVELAEAGGMPLAEATCRLAWALCETPEATEVEAMRSLALGRRCGSAWVVSQGLLGLAVAATRRGDEARAAELVREGFALARELGVLGFVTFMPGELADCCAVALGRAIEPQYVKRLIQANRLTPGDRAAGRESWPWCLRIDALGGFELRLNERVLHPGGPRTKPIEMLQFLVAHGPHGIRQELLSAALWPDADGDAAHRAMGTTLYRLRRLLGRADLVVQQAGRVALDPGLAYVDAWELERVLCEAEAMQRGDDEDGVRLETLRSRMRDLYRGDLFGRSGGEPPFDKARALRERSSRWIAVE